MDNVLKFPERVVDTYQETKRILKTEKFITFYYADEGQLCYLWGSDLTLGEITYLQKILDVFVSDKIKDNVKWEDS